MNPPFLFLVDGSHGHFHHGKGARAHRHSPSQCRSNALPESPEAIGAVCRGEAGPHGRVLLLSAKAVGLHLALDDIEGVAGKPEDFSGKASVQGDLVGGDVFAVDAVARGVRVHQVLKGGEPGAVGKGLSPDGHGLAAVQAAQGAVVGADLADAVQGPVVELPCAVRLALQADADVLDGARQRRVGHAGKGARGEVLRIAEAARLVAAAGVASLEPAPRRVECAKLQGHAGADADERRQRALVEGEGAFVLVDGGGGLEGARVLARRLETDFDDVKGLAWQVLVSSIVAMQSRRKACLRAVARIAPNPNPNPNPCSFNERRRQRRA